MYRFLYWLKSAAFLVFASGFGLMNLKYVRERVKSGVVSKLAIWLEPDVGGYKLAHERPNPVYFYAWSKLLNYYPFEVPHYVTCWISDRKDMSRQDYGTE